MTTLTNFFPRNISMKITQHKQHKERKVGKEKHYDKNAHISHENIGTYNEKESRNNTFNSDGKMELIIS